MIRRSAAALLVAATFAPAAAGQAVDESAFRYVRPLAVQAPRAGSERAIVRFEPDGPLFAHAKPGFADLRVLDARDRQVPWRRLPEATPTSVVAEVLNRGSREGKAVALLDLGPQFLVHDRLELEIPQRKFVGRVTVFGSDSRQGPFTRLSTTVVYDVAGARRARSTAVVYPRSDFRYLRLVGTGIETIAGARVVEPPPGRPKLEQRSVRDVDVAQRPRETVLTLDLGFRNVPVDELRITAATPRYLRPVAISGSNDRRRWVTLATGRVFRFADSVAAPVAVGARHRYLRVTIENGDDEPLAGIRAQPLARPRTLLLAPGRAPPFRLLYGARNVDAPEYDFARLPVEALDLAGAATGRLARERLNELYRKPEDERSFAARHPIVVQGALALAAAVLALGGFLALRRRA